MIDQKPCFKEQAGYALEKGDKFIGQYKWLVKPTKGAAARHMHQFCLTVPVPRNDAICS
jgi:hypothetical protein